MLESAPFKELKSKGSRLFSVAPCMKDWVCLLSLCWVSLPEIALLKKKNPKAPHLKMQTFKRSRTSVDSGSLTSPLDWQEFFLLSSEEEILINFMHIQQKEI